MKKIFTFLLTLAIVFSFVSTISFAASRNEVDPGALGDANGDGKINVWDASLVLQYIAKWDLSEKTFIEDAADVTHDDKINTADVSKLMKYLARWHLTELL